MYLIKYGNRIFLLIWFYICIEYVLFIFRRLNSIKNLIVYKNIYLKYIYECICRILNY